MQQHSGNMERLVVDDEALIDEFDNDSDHGDQHLSNKQVPDSVTCGSMYPSLRGTSTRTGYGAKETKSESGNSSKAKKQVSSSSKRNFTPAADVNKAGQRSIENAWLQILVPHGNGEPGRTVQGVDKTPMKEGTKAKAKIKAIRRVMSEKDATRYAAVLSVNGVSTQDAMTLSDARLKQMGITKSSHRAAVLDCVREMVVRQVQKRKDERAMSTSTCTTSSTTTTSTSAPTFSSSSCSSMRSGDEAEASVVAATEAVHDAEPSLESVWYSLLLENKFEVSDAKRYAAGFAHNNVDEREAVALTDEKLRVGGITDPKHRGKILTIIDALLAQYDRTRGGDNGGDTCAFISAAATTSEKEQVIQARRTVLPNASESNEETEAHRLELEKQLRHYEVFQHRLAKVLAGDTDKQRAARAVHAKERAERAEQRNKKRVDRVLRQAEDTIARMRKEAEK